MDCSHHDNHDVGNGQVEAGGGDSRDNHRARPVWLVEPPNRLLACGDGHATVELDDLADVEDTQDLLEGEGWRVNVFPKCLHR